MKNGMNYHKMRKRKPVSFKVNSGEAFKKGNEWSHHPPLEKYSNRRTNYKTRDSRSELKRSCHYNVA